MYNMTRSGCRDIWNAYMCKNTVFTSKDIPICPSTAKRIPSEMILWDEAKYLYKKTISNGQQEFIFDKYICFYQDDYKFDGPKGIWYDSQNALKIIRHFAGVITPDFSTYQDFPEPIKRYNTYRMRAFGCWLVSQGVSVINNVRWGTEESWTYCWEGIPKHSIVAIGTVGGNPRKRIDRHRFEEGLAEMVRVLQPHTILVYGSANFPCFESLKKQGIKIVSYQSRTAAAFERRQQK